MHENELDLVEIIVYLNFHLIIIGLTGYFGYTVVRLAELIMDLML